MLPYLFRKSIAFVALLEKKSWQKSNLSEGIPERKLWFDFVIPSEDVVTDF